MNRVPRPLDISWNESERHGVTVVESRAATRWTAWSAVALALLVVPCGVLLLALLLSEPWSGMPSKGSIGIALYVVAMLAAQVGYTLRQWNNKTIRLSPGSVGFFQRFARRRALHFQGVQRVTVQRRRWLGWNVELHTPDGRVTLPFGFRSGAHAEFAASRMAEITCAEYAPTGEPSTANSSKGLSWSETLTREGATLRYREPTLWAILPLSSVFLAGMALNSNRPGHNNPVMFLIALINVLQVSLTLAFKHQLKLSPNSLSVTHPLTVVRPKVQGTIESFSVRRETIAWTVVAITSDGTATPIGMRSWKEAKARATAEKMNELLRTVRSNAATGYRVGSVSTQPRVAERPESAHSAFPEGDVDEQHRR